jgi:hypothetical protein
MATFRHSNEPSPPTAADFEREWSAYWAEHPDEWRHERPIPSFAEFCEAQYANGFAAVAESWKIHLSRNHYSRHYDSRRERRGDRTEKTTAAVSASPASVRPTGSSFSPRPTGPKKKRKTKAGRSRSATTASGRIAIPTSPKRKGPQPGDRYKIRVRLVPPRGERVTSKGVRLRLVVDNDRDDDR